LLLIKRLQGAHLPLSEIRRRIEGMDEASISETLASPREPDTSSAADYVRSVLGQQAPEQQHKKQMIAPQLPQVGMRRSLDADASDVQPGAGAASPSRPSPAPPPQVAQSPAPAQQSVTRSTWERIPLAPDVELHLRRPLSREQNRFVERLLEAARRLFTEEI
jgi:hypothetical protein